jgi:hypothetical protein
MKILLDIDGVMIPANPWRAYEMDSDGFGMFSKKSVESLNQILKKSIQPEIILTSSHKQKFTIEKWCDIFSKRGVLPVNFSRLDTDSLQTNRKDEIITWYLKNQNDPFIIIDDDKRLNSFDNNFKDDHLVLTNPSIGLNSSSAQEAISKIMHLQKEHFS